MNNTLIYKDIKIAGLLLLLCGVLYPVLINGLGIFYPEAASGYPIYRNGELTGFRFIGQDFRSQGYFTGRPSAISYNPAISGGSNQSFDNPGYLTDIDNRIAALLLRYPGINKELIPADLVTASGSGLDPHISPESAYIQAAAVAAERGLNPGQVYRLIDQYTEKPLWGLWKPYTVNVLLLNIALDNLTMGDK